MIFVFLEESGILSLGPGSPEEKNWQRSEKAPKIGERSEPGGKLLKKPSTIEVRFQDPLTKNLESSTWNLESIAWNPEYKTLLNYLTWGESDAHTQAIIISYNDVTRPLELSMPPVVMWSWAPLKYHWLYCERCAVWLWAASRKILTGTWSLLGNKQDQVVWKSIRSDLGFVNMTTQMLCSGLELTRLWTTPPRTQLS